MAGIQMFLARLLSRITLMRKVVLIFLLCVLLPLILQSVFFFSTTSNDMKDLIHQQAAGTFDQVALSAGFELDDAHSLLLRYYNDSQLGSWLDQPYSSERAFLVVYQEQIAPLISHDLSLQSQIDRVELITDNPTVFSGAYIRQSGDMDIFDPATERCLYELPISGSRLSVTLHLGQRKQPGSQLPDYLVSLACEMNEYPELKSCRKMVRLDLKLDTLRSLMAEVPLFEDMYITDTENRILVSAKTVLPRERYITFNEGQLPEDAILMSKRLHDHLPFILYAYYDSGIVTDDFQHTLLVSLGIAAGSLMIAFCALLIIGRDLHRRMNALVQKAQRIARGDFSNLPVLTMAESRDEIVQVERSVDDMSLQLSSYIQREYEGRISQAELEKEVIQARLQALQSQVNPHFLFNALECIRLNALDSEPSETARVIKNLARMFRYLVQWEGDIVCLHEELSFLNEFLRIQEYRFGDEFHYQICIDVAAQDCLLPKLILQPLVENACVHGVESTSNEKHIDISVRLSGSNLCLRVTDSGKGISPERLELLRRQMRDKTATGSVGLHNVYQRLELYYQDRFTFTIDSVPEQGTQCTVIIPATHRKES